MNTGPLCSKLVTSESSIYTFTRQETGFFINGNRLTRLSLAIGLSVTSASALASPEQFMSSRSFAMGGTGVATGQPGAEFDAWHYAQLRVGVRHNLASNENNNGIEEETQFTAGLGLNLLGVRMDLGALYSDADVGAALEFGTAF